MRRFQYFAYALTAAMFLASAAAAAQAGPTAFLKSIDKKLKPLLQDADKNQKKIINIMNSMMDFDALCQDALGKHWDARTKAEQKEFVDTLHAVIEKNMVTRLKDSKDHIITYEKENLSGDTASVVTIVANGTGPRAEKIEIEYKMQKHGKKWLVVDMVTDGVSLVSNYRSQFNKIITKDGWDVLMQKMKDKLAK